MLGGTDELDDIEDDVEDDAIPRMQSIPENQRSVRWDQNQQQQQQQNRRTSHKTSPSHPRLEQNNTNYTNPSTLSANSPFILNDHYNDHDLKEEADLASLPVEPGSIKVSARI